jgi:hypothetical protein
MESLSYKALACLLLDDEFLRVQRRIDRLKLEMALSERELNDCRERQEKINEFIERLVDGCPGPS